MGMGSFAGVKRPGRGVDHLCPFSAEVKGRVVIPSSWDVMACFGVKFTFPKSVGLPGTEKKASLFEIRCLRFFRLSWSYHIVVFILMTTCSFVCSYGLFGGTGCLHFKSWDKKSKNILVSLTWAVPYAMRVSEHPYSTPTVRKGQHPTVHHRYGAGSASSVERLDWTIRGSNPCTHKRKYLGFIRPPISRSRRCIQGVERSRPEVGHLTSTWCRT